MGRYSGRPYPATGPPDQLQPDPHVLQGPGHCWSRGWRLPDLTIRWPYPGLVQGQDWKDLLQGGGPRSGICQGHL